MPTGPSKEQLEYYFKNSRQYFDELAKQYYETDRQYYNEYIAPFYGPFSRGPKPGRAPVRLVIVALLASMIFGIGVVTFFLTTREEPEEKEIPGTKQKPTVSIQTGTDTSFTQVIIDSTIENMENLSDYHKGLVYYTLKDYDKAEEYLEKVPSSDMFYKDAQNKLKEIKSMDPRDKRYVRPRALERTR